MWGILYYNYVYVNLKLKEREMKFFVSASLLALSISVAAQAGPGASRMARVDEFFNLSRTVLMHKRFIHTPTAKRFFVTQKSTKGFRPKDQSPQFSYVQLPTKVEFLDVEHEIFIPISPKKQFSKVSPPHIKKESDHTVDVDLKKK